MKNDIAVTGCLLFRRRGAQRRRSRAAAGQMCALSNIVLLCPLPQYIMDVKKIIIIKKHYRGQNRTLTKYKSK